MNLATWGLIVDAVGFVIMFGGGWYPLVKEPEAAKQEGVARSLDGMIENVRASQAEEIENLKAFGSERDVPERKKAHLGDLQHLRGEQTKLMDAADRIRTRARFFQKWSLIIGAILFVVGLAFQVYGASVQGEPSIVWRWIGYSA